MRGRIVGVNNDISGFQRDFANAGNGVPGIDARLARIWSTCDGSSLTGRRFAPGIQARLMSSPISRR